MEKFSNIGRNPNRMRRVSGRTRVRPYQSMTPMGEAMMAKDLGLDQEIAAPLKIEGEDEEQMFLHNNVRIWE